MFGHNASVLGFGMFKAAVSVRNLLHARLTVFERVAAVLMSEVG